MISLSHGLKHPSTLVGCRPRLLSSVLLSPLPNKPTALVVPFRSQSGPPPTVLPLDDGGARHRNPRSHMGRSAFSGRPLKPCVAGPSALWTRWLTSKYGVFDALHIKPPSQSPSSQTRCQFPSLIPFTMPMSREPCTLTSRSQKTLCSPQGPRWGLPTPDDCAALHRCTRLETQA
jgi:hypothetical protein